jgi:hypothetical protein
MNGYKLLDIVEEFLLENGKSENQRGRIYTIALSGLRELHLDVNGIIKIVELPVNDNDTVDLPNDFINYRKIGIVGGDGRIHAMGRDNNISLQPDCGVDGRDIQKNEGVNTFAGLPFAGSFWGIADGNGGVFSVGGGNNTIGYYRFNRKLNQLWLSGLNTTNSIIVEYIADLNTDDNGEDFIVNPYCIEAIKTWISWKYVSGDRNTGAGEKQMRRQEYFNSLRICKNRYGSSTPEEWKEALQKNNMAAPRF